jgi:hypothetical protein
MEKNAGLLGNIVSFKKTSGFNVSVSTFSGTTIIMTYDVQWQYGKSSDSVLLVKDKGDIMKIYRYSWKHSGTKYVSELNESGKQARKYMDAIKAGNYSAAVDLCSAEALAITPKDKWTSLLENAAAKLGPVSGYQILSDSSAYTISAQGGAGKGNYYDIIIQSDRNNSKVMEKVVFFQKDYTEPVKLTGHFFL